MVEVDTLSLIKWSVRFIYVIIVLGLAALTVIAFLGAFDNLSFDNNATEVYAESGEDSGDFLVREVPQIYDFSGVLGILARVEEKDVQPILSDDDGPLTRKTLSKNSKGIQWISFSMNTASNLTVSLVLSSPGEEIPWEIGVYTTTDLRLIPRILLPILIGLFIVAAVVFEWRFYIYESRYGSGTEGAKRVDRRKTRFF